MNPYTAYAGGISEERMHRRMAGYIGSPVGVSRSRCGTMDRAGMSGNRIGFRAAVMFQLIPGRDRRFASWRMRP